MISILIGHKGRCTPPNDTLGPCLASLRTSLDAIGDVSAELVIAHWPTADDPNPFPRWISERWGAKDRPLKILEGVEPFSRGPARMLAAKAAVGETLFFCDADMLVGQTTITRGLEVAATGRAYFPTYDRLYPNREPLRGVGTGNAILARELFDLSPGYPHSDGWGGDDTAFYHWFKSRSLIDRDYPGDLYHQWHEPSKDKLS